MRIFLVFKRLAAFFQTPQGRLSAVALSVIAFFVAFIFFFPIFGLPISYLGLFSILIVAWNYGIWTGWLFAFAIYCIDTLVIIRFGWGTIRMAWLPGQFFGLGIGLVLSLFIGKQGEHNRRTRQQLRENSTFLEEAQQRLRELAGLQELSQAFSYHGDRRQTFDSLCRILAELTGSGICWICSCDPSMDELIAQVPAYGLDDQTVSQFHWSPTQMGESWDLTQRSTIQANSLAGMPEQVLPMARLMGLKSVLAVALRDGDNHLLGAIFTANKSAGFSESDARLLDVLASQVSVVIRYVQLSNAERRLAEQLQVLNSITLAAKQADNEDQLIEQVSSIIGQRLYCDSFGVLLLDESTHVLYLHSSYRIGPHAGLHRIPTGGGVFGAVIKSGKPLRVQDVSISPDYPGLISLSRSVLCVPLELESKIVGVINAESRQINGFTETDEELLTIVAGQLASAIQRLRTARADNYQTQQLERSNSLIRALAQVNARAAVAAEADGVLQTLGTELSKLGLRCAIVLSSPDDENSILRYISLPDRIIHGLERIGNIKLKNFSIPIEKFAPYSDASMNASLFKDPDSTLLGWVPNLPKHNAQKILKLIGLTRTTSVCYLPLITEGKPMGILWMWGEGIHESDMPTMSLFASQLAAALQNANLLTEVGRLAITDELTGIFNRRHFFSLAEEKFSRAQKRNSPLTALIVDLDHFKKFNDTYGHAIGDQVLRAAAQMMANSLRESDIIGRYGGEEFSIILPDTNNSAAIFAAERLLARVSDVPIATDAGELSIQLSIGIAGMSKDTPTLHSLIVRADEALYLAKSAGRNRLAVK